MSKQQLRAYTEGATAKSLMQQAGGAGIELIAPGYNASGLSTTCTSRRLLY